MNFNQFSCQCHYRMDAGIEFYCTKEQTTCNEELCPLYHFGKTINDKMLETNMCEIAKIAHAGAYFGYKNFNEALIRIRKLSYPWLDIKEIEKVQKEQTK